MIQDAGFGMAKLVTITGEWRLAGSCFSSIDYRTLFTLAALKRARLSCTSVKSGGVSIRRISRSQHGLKTTLTTCVGTPVSVATQEPEPTFTNTSIRRTWPEYACRVAEYGNPDIEN